jgi:tRNA A37 threonylcarbamoyladenosine dehydratase
MDSQFIRTELIIGEEAVSRLAQSRVIIFGIGGVGGYTCEALARGGIGHFDLVDKDVVDVSNINRQIIALHDTVGRYKTEVMKERILSINPCAEVVIHNTFFLPENSDDFDFNNYDYVIDAVDTVTAKLEIIQKAKATGVPVISAMGAGNKLDAGAFKVADIYDTKVCPLARVMRKELKVRGIKNLKVVYSEEKPVNTAERTPGSISYAPGICGLMIAGEVIKDLTLGFSINNH